MNRIIFILLLVSGCNGSNQPRAVNSNDSSERFQPPVIADTQKQSPETKQVVSPINRPRAADNPHWKKKKYEGVHLLAIGNEPFWNLEFRNNQSILFLLAEWEKAVEIPVDQSFKAGVKNEIKGKDIVVYVVPETCSDGMSDYVYDYSVRVVYKDTSYKGCGIALVP